MIDWIFYGIFMQVVMTMEASGISIVVIGIMMRSALLQVYGIWK